MNYPCALAQGGFDGESYIQVMDRLADKAAITLEQTGRLTVVVQDNGSLQSAGVSPAAVATLAHGKAYSCSFCRPTCSEMNRIEDEWHQLKTHEIVGQMFEDEYDLAIAVMKGMNSRSEKGEYSRFTF